jgi:hypothetical protein
MKLIPWFGFALFCFLISNVEAQPPVFSDLNSLNWLAGEWKSTGAKTTSFEVWKRVSDRTFEGESYYIKDGEKTVAEYLRIELFGSEIFYTSRVSHNKYPVPFKLVKAENKTFTFENVDHDFPQRIIYKLKEDGSLHARIEGQQNGKERGVDFFFVQSTEQSQ